MAKFFIFDDPTRYEPVRLAQYWRDKNMVSIDSKPTGFTPYL